MCSMCSMFRVMFAVLILALVLVLTAGSVVHAGALQPPEGRKIRVAVVMTEGAVPIDYAGPWEVFENVHAGKGAMGQQMPCEPYTVGRDRQPSHTSGGMKPGMTVVPDYGFADAPAPDVVVVGAQSGDDQLGPWLRKVHEQHALIMPVHTDMISACCSWTFRSQGPSWSSPDWAPTTTTSGAGASAKP